jgi:RimJ/RimL family protein N-acetyltransferase
LTIETERLLLVPLTANQLKLWIENIPKLEVELNVKYEAEAIEGIFLEIIKSQYEKTKKVDLNYLFHSFWFIVRKTDSVVVGSADFKDVPNEKGEVEIGYGLGEQFEHNGYMTETVEAMCKWAFEQDKVSTVIAETDIDGFASGRILTRCGFKQYKQGETLWWRLSMDNKLEFDSEFCNVKYIEKDNVVFLTWKKFCCFDDYRKPTTFALELLKEHSNSNFVFDARNGFEDDKADVEWGFDFLLPEMGKTDCKKIAFILNEVNEIEDEMDMWTVEFKKYFEIVQVVSYEEAVKFVNS